MQAIQDRYADGTAAGFQRKTTLDSDRRPGELSTAIRMAKRGSDDALAYLYRRFSGNVYGYARSIVRDDHEAEDVAQQVFARLMTSLASYEQRSVPFSAWLLRITHNLAIDQLRRRRATPCAEVRAPTEAGDDDHGLSLALREALSQLPDGQREVVVLRHVAGWTPGEIAERLDKSEDAIHGLHHRGRRALKDSLRQLEAAPVTAAAA